MEDRSVFLDKAVVPTDTQLAEQLGSTYNTWLQLRNHVAEICPQSVPEWNYPGVKYGWSFRVKDKKRALIYFLPRENYFKVAFVFGEKATDMVLHSNVSAEIKKSLALARPYAEGRGIRVDVKSDSQLGDIAELLKIKMKAK